MEKPSKEKVTYKQKTDKRHNKIMPVIKTKNQEMKNPESLKAGDPRIHMANERTFLAWIRTSIGIMAFGFVVEKFTLFLKQMSIILGSPTLENKLPSTHGFSAFIGILLVSLGTLLVLFAFLKYKKVEKQIGSGTFQSSSILNIFIAASILVVGIFLVTYLIHGL